MPRNNKPRPSNSNHHRRSNTKVTFKNITTSVKEARPNWRYIYVQPSRRRVVGAMINTQSLIFRVDLTCKRRCKFWHLATKFAEEVRKNPAEVRRRINLAQASAGNAFLIEWDMYLGTISIQVTESCPNYSQQFPDAIDSFLARFQTVLSNRRLCSAVHVGSGHFCAVSADLFGRKYDEKGA